MVDRAKRVDFHSQTMAQQVHDALEQDGVVVLENVFTHDECNETIQGIASSIHALNKKVSKTGQHRGWDSQNLPLGPRSGMMQSVVANLPSVWHIRSHPHMRAVFKAAYTGFRVPREGRAAPDDEEEDKDLQLQQVEAEDASMEELFTSIDGLTMRPPVEPFFDGSRDWAHLDQASTDDPYWCIQGQAVLTDATEDHAAAFRCSIGSHKLFKDILALEGKEIKPENNDFHMLSSKALKFLRKALPNKSQDFQVPIHTTKGSVILWTSSTVHSAKPQSKPPAVSQPQPAKSLSSEDSAHHPDGVWKDWRCVLYVCYRPRCDLTDPTGHAQLLNQAFMTNAVTNHSAKTVFPACRGPKQKRILRDMNTQMADYVRHPTKVFSRCGQPDMTLDMLALLNGQAPSAVDAAADE